MMTVQAMTFQPYNIIVILLSEMALDVPGPKVKTFSIATARSISMHCFNIEGKTNRWIILHFPTELCHKFLLVRRADKLSGNIIRAGVGIMKAAQKLRKHPN
jgi:hypothetical protein